MFTTRSFAIVGLALLLLSGLAQPGRAQATRYQATPDTLRYESANSYLLYFVRNGDTLGQPISTRTLETRLFSADGANLRAYVRLNGTGEFAFTSSQLLTVSPTGTLLAVDGRPVAQVPGARVDFLPRLSGSPAPLRQGDSWSDTVAVSESRAYGATYYRGVRQYTVARLADTLGTTVALIVGRGQLQLRQGGWQDSTAGSVWWQEVGGPVADSTWFDTRHGQILQASTMMDLVGVGGAGPIGAGVRMPSGLRSSVRLTSRR